MLPTMSIIRRHANSQQPDRPLFFVLSTRHPHIPDGIRPPGAVDVVHWAEVDVVHWAEMDFLINLVRMFERVAVGLGAR